jgi:hypothetical protein
VYAQVVGASILMALGAVAIALSTAPGAEYRRWQEAAQREAERYGVEPESVGARLAGYDTDVPRRRSPWDWLIVGAATAVFIGFALDAQAPELQIHRGWTLGLTLAMLGLLGGCGVALWRTTRLA